MPQIVDSRGMVSATVTPVQLLAQADEDTFHVASVQRQTPSSPTRGDEERGIGLRRHAGNVTHPAIAT